MPIPDFQTIMKPLLVHLSDGRARTNQETLDALAVEFRVTPEEREELLPSGRQALFTNRVAWAKSHLKQAGLIESPERGVYRITDRGRDLLANSSGKINMRALEKFPEYRRFRKRRGKSKSETRPANDQMTPEEHIEHGYEQIRKQLAADILDRVKQSPPRFFERLVIELLVSMGYGGSRADAGKAAGGGADGGIDGIIKEDRLGLDAVYVQAKRWDGPVGRPDVQKFAGALQGHRARKGVFITTSSFSREAVDYVSKIDSKIALIGGEELAELMIDFGIGVTKVGAVEIKRIDTDYFVGEE